MRMRFRRSRFSTLWIALMLVASLQLASFVAVTPAHAVPQALILGSTVTACGATVGCPMSLEEEQAIAAGFAVTVVNDVTWLAMTAAQFAAYQVIIIGDPTCGITIDGVATTNMGVWQPVVMANGGNRIVIGTDPVFHKGSFPGAVTLVRQGIAFAGAVAGATGAYIDLSCSTLSTTGNTPMTFLDGLTSGPANQFTSELPPCAGAISIVAASGPTSGITNADLSNWACSVHVSFKTWAADFTPLAIATDSATKPYCANDVESGLAVCGAPYILISGGGIVVTSNISLTPPTATNPVGTDHTVTATVVHDCLPDNTGCTPQAGVTVTFLVTSGPNLGATDTDVTDALGQATFTYTDSGGAGTDTISASFTDDAGSIQSATAAKTWVADVGCVPVDCNDDNPCTDDSCDTTGAAPVCVNTANTLPCDDGNGCTSGDICDDTECVGTTPTLCDDPNQCQDTGSCNPLTGLCEYPSKIDGTTCSDNNGCTIDDVCLNGACVTTPRNCSDDNACTVDTCSNAGGGFLCVNTACTSVTDSVCPPACEPIFCGNGTLEAGETCDPPDANPDPDRPGQPLCRPDCTSCGDGVVQAANAEICDDGNVGPSCDPRHPQKPNDPCQNNCTPPICNDPSRITLTNGIDRYDFHGRIVPVAPDLRIDPVNKAFVLQLVGASGQVVFRASLDANVMSGSAGSRSFKYRNRDAARTGGIAKLRIAKAKGSYRVYATAYGELGAASSPMETHLFLQDQHWTIAGSWDKLQQGWRFTGR